jgi:hypothetical protein
MKWVHKLGFEQEQVFVDCLDRCFKFDQLQLNSLIMKDDVN